MKNALYCNTKPQSEVSVPNWFDFPSLADHFFGLNPVSNTLGFQPKSDIVETDKSFKITVALPGMKKTDVKIEMVGKQLKISGEHQTQQESNTEKIYKREIVYGKFFREFQLGEGLDTENIKASMENGILELEIPKSEKTQPKMVEIS